MEEKLENMLLTETDATRIAEIQYRIFVFKTVNAMKERIMLVESLDSTECNAIIDGINMLCSIMAPLNYDKYLMCAGRYNPYDAKAAGNGDNDNYKKLLEKRYVKITNAFSFLQNVEDFKEKAAKNLVSFANDWWTYRQDFVCKL